MVLFIAAVLAPLAALAEKAAVPRPQDNLVLAETPAKELLLLMNPDEQGIITKQQWIKFMDQEFDRLDTSRDGKINVKDLMRSNSLGTPRNFQDLGK